MKLKIGLLVCLVPLVVNMAMAEDQHLSAVVKSVNDFTLDFYLTTVAKSDPGKNVLVSPLSASLATALVHAGANGITAQEIETGLHFPRDKTTLDNGFKALHAALANTPNVTLDIANRVFIEKSSTIKPDYKQRVTQIHNSEIQQADFKNNFEKERANINGWVSQKTHDKINDLLPAGILDSLTRLVLVNAVYFYGKWKEQFDKAQTYEEDFYITKDKTVQVPMMHQTKNLRYADIPELDAKAVELCYVNENVCLQIILPNAKDGLQGLHEKLKNKTFDLSKIEFYRTKVQLTMPKFKIEQTIDLKQVYKEMNINTMFGQGADLKGMIEGDEGEALYVSDAIQKTFMDVNEEGTEAAAATACVSRRKRCLEDLPVELYVDHPFLFRLLNLTTVIFVGAHYEPTTESSEDYADALDDNEDPHFSDTPKPDDTVHPHKPSHCEL
ncbi:hypothetical protein ONE63_001238 [Megalurothrips usitatus]|uniref:Serpin domain-containing protein n=1 Tax=Megalurothrips usitatus TaxID=439358 RepID=A0AAV7XIR7_9NEOP|nr:hypothetical protein ONE63_001238 [Megalurothrips usitatus]